VSSPSRQRGMSVDVPGHLHHEENIPNKYTALGKYGRANQEQMNATKLAIKEAGWMDDSPNGISEVDKEPIQPDILQSGSK